MRGLLLSGVLLIHLSCAPPPPQAQPQSPAASASAEIAAVRSAQIYAQQQPGALSAYKLAQTIHGYAQAGHYATRNALLHRDASDAVNRLNAASAQTAQDRALLATWRGVLHLDLGQADLAMAELEGALDIAPTNLAAGALVSQYATRGEMQKIFDVCKRVAPALQDPDEIYQLTQHCMQNSRAISREAALAWAPPAHVDWFNQETRRRQAIQATQQQRQAVLQQQQAAQQAAIQQQQRQQQEQAARTKSNDAIANYACSQECRETAYDCLAECSNNACEFGCTSRRDHCLRKCKN